MKRQSGFTLIELIIVIVILGILAVTAAPQFFNFGSDARESTVRGMEGSVKAAADLVYARAAIEGQEREGADSENTVNIGSGETGETVAIAFGYPTAAALENAINYSVEDWTFTDAASGVAGSAEAGDRLIIPSDLDSDSANDPETACFVFYRQVNAAGNHPTIGSVVEGC